MFCSLWMKIPEKWRLSWASHAPWSWPYWVVIFQTFFMEMLCLGPVLYLWHQGQSELGSPNVGQIISLSHDSQKTSLTPCAWQKRNVQQINILNRIEWMYSWVNESRYVWVSIAPWWRGIGVNQPPECCLHGSWFYLKTVTYCSLPSHGICGFKPP
jgi:hypothetical protein